MSGQYSNRRLSAISNQIPNRTKLNQDFTPLHSSFHEESRNLLNRQRSYAEDLQCLSDLFIDPFADERDAAEDVNSLTIKKQILPDIQTASKTRFCTNDRDTQIAKTTTITNNTDHTETESRLSGTDIYINARAIDPAQKGISTHKNRSSASDAMYIKEYIKKYDYTTNSDARTDDNTRRIDREELRDAPSDPTVQLRLERICSRLAVPQHDLASSKRNESVVWTEYKHWKLCMVEETEHYIQFELRRKGEKTCLTLFNDEAYFAVVALIDCSANPRELIFEFSNPGCVPMRADYSFTIHNIQRLLESKKSYAKEKKSRRKE